MLELSKFSNLISHYHSNYANKESNKTRGHDKQTPYYVHPIGCAYFIMEDNNDIEYFTRLKLCIVMMAHDVLEDTSITKELLYADMCDVFNNVELAQECLTLIELCTLAPGLGSIQEYELLKHSIVPDEVYYIKMVDKYFNIFGSKKYFISKGTLDIYLEFLSFLVNKVKHTEFSKSSFIVAAEALINNLIVE